MVTPRPGDYILVRLGGDKAHVDTITPEGERIRVQSDVLRFTTAYKIVCVGASEHGGRMLMCHVSTPGALDQV